MKHEFKCRFCNEIMLVNYSQYKENMYCNKCLQERLKLGKNIHNNTFVKTFGSYRPLKIKTQQNLGR